MSLGHGANVVRDGLVFHYDMGNDKKSWKGAPTTNLITGALSGMQGVSLTFLGIDSGWKKYAMSGTFTAGTYPYIMNMSSTSFTGGVTYSSSCYIKTNVAYKFNYFATGMNYVNQPMTKGGTSFSIAQPDGSFYVGRSNFAYTSTTTQVGFLSTNPINNTTFNAATDFVWFKNGQVELGEFPTPFAGDSATRTNTEAIVDLTSNNTITANSLTYDSDGSFNFVGVGGVGVAGDYISCGNFSAINFGFGDFTISFISYRTSTGYQGGSFISKGDGTSLGFDFRDSNFYVHGTTGLIAQQGFNPTLNVWQQHDFVFNRSSSPYIKYYLNGEYNSASTTNNAANIGSSINTSRNLDIARSQAGGVQRYFNGKMPVVKLYNKALSEAEIKQNFEATRGRYGI